MHIQSLNSNVHNNWRLCRLGDDKYYDAKVPGSVHVDLLHAGVIPDPFVGVNELRVQWVAETDWLYRLSFDAETEIMNCSSVFLECDGLDTIATIKINGNEVAHTDNMFRRYRFDVKDIVKLDGNIIEVEFASPVNTVKAKIGQGNVITPGDSIEGSPYIRKAMYQWGWDWAPKIPTSGIWKEIRLVGYNSARIEDVLISQTHDGEAVTLGIDVSIERFAESDLNLSIAVTDPKGAQMCAATSLPTGDKMAHFDICIDEPQLWWPNGYGDQPLYNLKVDLLDNDNIIHSCSKNVGLRTLELLQQPDQWGKTFMFVVNGVPIFAKGADWVPADQFPARIDAARYEKLIRDAAVANMNMLRVWGGGLYESDDFYYYCDNYGILVWQDFMFACAHYPSDPEYLENVRLEAIDNIRRIRGHASLALWCGNNEIEWMISGGWGGDRIEEIKKEYMHLFYELLPEVHAAEDPATPYWPASPASSEPFNDPNCEGEGDGHYWDVWHGRLPFTAYRKHYFRFMSEFGFESLPAYDTIKSFAEPKDMNITSLVMENHQKNSAGNGLILYYMAQTFLFPKSFQYMVYVSQLLQAEAMRYGVEHWRRNRNGFRCMGTLYWQYNDCWPVASWASIDYYNRWKALQYFAKRFYAPVLISAEEDPNGARLHVTNDGIDSFSGLVRWSLETLDGAVIRNDDIQVDVPSGCDVNVTDLDFSDYLDFDSRRQTVLVYELYHNGDRVSMGMATFVPSKHLELSDAQLSTTIEEIGDQIQISLAADKAVRYVMLEVPGRDLQFSDNYFDLPARRIAKIWVSAEDISINELREGLRVTHLKESY